MPVDPLARFFQAVARDPQHPAVDTGRSVVGYGSLGHLVRRMAYAIDAALPAGAERRVLIHLPQGAAAYAAMFATLMAGGFYAPVNVGQPPGQRRALVQRFDPAVVIGRADEVAAIGLDPTVPVIDPDSLDASEMAAPRAPHALAYVIFTSGSTGVPKGVMLGRTGLAHYVDWALGAMAVRPTDRWSQHPNIGFDLSVLDIYGALCAGATLVPITDRRDRLLPAEAIARHRLTIWDSVPSVVDLMRRGGQMTAERLASLRLMTFCGEPLLPAHLQAIFDIRPDVIVHNTYGPTEATVSMTLLCLTKETFREATQETVALGAPIPGMSLQLMGDDDNPDEGEIVIGGPQVAHGYWREPELTDRAFGRSCIDGRDQPIYRTGDWAVRRSNHLYFAARLDRQTKIHGHRLELGEIDAVLRRAGALAAHTLVADGRIIAFVELADDKTPAALRQACGESLPDYAMPHIIEPLDQLPRSANDKIDAGPLRDLAQRLVGVPT